MSEKSEKGLLNKQLEACRFNKCLLLLQCGKVRVNVNDRTATVECVISRSHTL